MAKKTKLTVYPNEWRTHKKLALEQASERSGITKCYLHDLKNGHPMKRWSVVHLEALGHAYDVEPEDQLWNPLIGGSPLWRLVKCIDTKDADQAAQILETFTKKAGNA